MKPVDLAQSSGLVWHDVPNRGGRITITADLRNSHDIGVSSGWQGDNAGANPPSQPPPIKAVVKALVPKVDADGNELGGVPTVLRDAPLGTYLGWNITSGPGDPTYDNRPFHAGQVCNYVGGMVPFAIHKADKQPGDPRPSLEERYGNHDGYVAAVKAAADNAACQGYLIAGPDAAAMGAKCTLPTLPKGFGDDWVQVVTQAMNSNGLK